MKKTRTSTPHSTVVPREPFAHALAFVLFVVAAFGVMAAWAPAVAAGSSATVTPRVAGPPERSGPPDGFEEVISFEVGSGPGQVGIAGGEERVTWGPAAFDLDERGRFHLIDGVNRRMLIVDPTSGEQSAVAWASPVVSPVDIAVVGTRTFVLDLSAQPAAVHEIDANGRAVSSWVIPAEYLNHGVSGLDVTLDRTGKPEIRLELAGSWQVQLVGAGSSGIRRPPVVMNGNVMRVPAAAADDFAIRRSSSDRGRAFAIDKDWNSRRAARVTAFANGRSVSTLRLRSENTLGSIRLLASDARENAYLWAEDLPAEGRSTRAFVKRFSASGTPAASFEIPIGAFAAFPLQPIRIADDGTAYLLLPGADRVSILRAKWERDTGETLPATTESMTPEPISRNSENDTSSGLLASLAESVRSLLAADTAVATWDPPDAHDRAQAYLNHRWFCSTSNFRTRNGSTRPRYIVAANRTYTGIPYCWGGFDSIVSYTNAMSAGLSAGDINTTGGKRAGTAGVDCSGFVSRLWGLGTKRSTSTLDDVARSVAKTAMRNGDIYLVATVNERHTMYFSHYTTGGAQVFEATTANSLDRVVTRNWTHSALTNYGAWRYQNW